MMNREKYLVKQLNPLLCNMCGNELKHYNYNGTFIWVCDDCPNMQCEIWNETDIFELNHFLIMNIEVKDNE